MKYLRDSASPSSSITNHNFHNRKGAAALICTITAAFVLLALAGTSISATLRVRQERRTERDLIQADYLCEAGLQRAINQLKLDSKYKGEIWLTTDVSPDLTHFEVNIKVLPVTNTLSDQASDKNNNISIKTFRVEITAAIKERQYVPTQLQRSIIEEIAITSPADMESSK